MVFATVVLDATDTAKTIKELLSLTSKYRHLTRIIRNICPLVKCVGPLLGIATPRIPIVRELTGPPRGATASRQRPPPLRDPVHPRRPARLDHIPRL